MSRDWSNIQTPFQYQRGGLGWFRTWLPTFLGGIDSAHYTYANRVWDHAEAQQNQGHAEFNFQDFTTLLNIAPTVEKGTALYNTKHQFINTLFHAAAFEEGDLCPTTLGTHWTCFSAHLDQAIKQSVQNTTIKFRLTFSKTLCDRNDILGPHYSRTLLNTSDLRDSFIEDNTAYSNEDLDFIFNHVCKINTLLNDKCLAKLVDQDHPLAARLIQRYTASIEQHTEHYAIISRLHYLKTETLELSILERIIRFFRPHSPSRSPAANAVANSPLSHQNVLENFIDRVIALENTKPCEDELKLFNHYRLAHAKDDPYFYLIAKAFKLTTTEDDKAIKCDWLKFDLKQGYRSNHLSPSVKEALLKTLKSNIKSIILNKFRAGEYKLEEAGIKTRECDRFGQGLKKSITNGGGADAIRHFIKCLTMSKDDKAYYKLASLSEAHPFIKDLSILHSAAEQLEKDPAISAYKAEKSCREQAARYFKPSPELKIAEFKSKVGRGLKIHEQEIDNASKRQDGEIDYETKRKIVSAIEDAGGEIISGDKRRQAAKDLEMIKSFR